MSPFPPPVAGLGLFIAKESNVDWAKSGSKLSVVNKTFEVSLIIVKVLAGTFEPTPPPVKYLTVKVVFEGATP